MSIAAIRDAFHGTVQGAGLRCVRARMRYVDADGVGTVHRDHVLVEFDCVRASDNLSKTFVSHIMKPNTHTLTESLKYAETVRAAHQEGQ